MDPTSQLNYYIVGSRCLGNICVTFQAKNALKRKKKIESLRDGKETALENIRHMLRIIQQVESDKMVKINQDIMYCIILNRNTQVHPTFQK